MHMRTDPATLPALFSLEGARRAALQPGRALALVTAHGTMALHYFVPHGEDSQTPHEQDEMYFIASGNGTFLRGSERFSFAAGDVLFVAAGVWHRFVDFSADFATWVIFYGPEGGEAP
jgi:mannose-6-phosphate isomerase-like protein (cupin superfamily)